MSLLERAWTLISYLDIVFRIFAFLIIYGFIRERFGTGLVGIILVLFFSYFIVLLYWQMFLPLFILYMILTLQFSHSFYDWAFMGQHDDQQELQKIQEQQKKKLYG